jgi:hypothetical protein
MLDRARLWIFRLTLIVLALALPACSRRGRQDAPTVTAVPSPALSPALSKVEGEVEGTAGVQFLFEDDFGDSGSGWLEAADAESSQGYRDGRFFFEIQSSDLLVWDNAGRNFRDFVLQVEARQVSGAVESSYGVLFRYIDDGNFYRFDLTGDGYHAVFKLEHGEWVTLADWQASEHVRPQGQMNRIKIVCRGPRTSFYVGDEVLVSVEDDSFERGDVGLFASTFSDPSTEAVFDNLQIWEVEE